MGASVASHWNSPVVGSGRFTVNEGYMAQWLPVVVVVLKATVPKADKSASLEPRDIHDRPLDLEVTQADLPS